MIKQPRSLWRSKVHRDQQAYLNCALENLLYLASLRNSLSVPATEKSHKANRKKKLWLVKIQYLIPTERERETETESENLNWDSFTHSMHQFSFIPSVHLDCQHCHPQKRWQHGALYSSSALEGSLTLYRGQKYQCFIIQAWSCLMVWE